MVWDFHGTGKNSLACAWFRPLNRNRAMKLNVVVSILAGSLFLSARLQAVAPPTTAATGIYDETTSQTNNVNFNASGNSHTASTGDGATYSTTGTFNSLVNTAFLAGSGGVVAFDDLSDGTSGTVLSVTYAGGTKQFSMSFSGNYTISTGFVGADSTAISDSNYLEPPATTALTITLGSISGASVGETGFSEIGLTLLSADVEGNPGSAINFGNLTVTAHFSDSTTASVSRVISEGKGAGDSFFDLLAPNGLTITSIDITGASGLPDLDDFAFITNAPVPEPSTLFLLLFFPLMLIGKRVLLAR